MPTGSPKLGSADNLIMKIDNLYIVSSHCKNTSEVLAVFHCVTTAEKKIDSQHIVDHSRG